MQGYSDTTRVELHRKEEERANPTKWSNTLTQFVGYEAPGNQQLENKKKTQFKKNVNAVNGSQQREKLCDKYWNT